MSDTPRTDAKYVDHEWDMHDHIPVEFARQLERELNSALDALAVIGEKHDRELNAAKAEIARLRGHLPQEVCPDCNYMRSTHATCRCGLFKEAQ